MALAGIKVPDTVLVRDAIDMSRSLLEPYLFNHVMRSWLFGISLSEGATPAPDLSPHHGPAAHPRGGCEPLRHRRYL